MVGESLALWSLRAELSRRALDPFQHTLLLGKTGVGKEAAARALHRLTPETRDKDIVPLNVSGITPSVAAAEFFGMAKDFLQKGHPGSEGLLKMAHCSTLFLDEIATLPPELQALLLRLLDKEGSYNRPGGMRLNQAQVRCIAATNEPLERLRPDFIYRFGTPICLPTLEERREDIPLLVEQALLTWSQATHPLRKQARSLVHWEDGKVRAELHPRLTAWLIKRAWPGNVRELLATLKHLVEHHQGPGVLELPDDEAEGLPPELKGDGRRTSVLRPAPVIPAPVVPAPPPPSLWSSDDLTQLEEFQRHGFVLDKCEEQLFGKKGKSTRTYALRRLIWRALHHHRHQPELAGEALFGQPLPLTDTASSKRLHQHIARAIQKALELQPDTPPPSQENYGALGLALGRAVGEAFRAGTLHVPERWRPPGAQQEARHGIR